MQFVPKNIKFYLLWAFVLSTSFSWSCNGGGCSSMDPPPANMPPSQTLENGMQIRITETGFETIKTILPQFIEGEYGHTGFIPEYWVGSSDHQYGIDFCSNNKCGIDISHVDLDFNVKDNVDDSNNIEQCRESVLAQTQCDEIWVDVETNIYIGFDVDVYFAGSNISNDCSINIGFDHEAFEATIAMGLRTRPTDGELRMDINSITGIDLGGLSATLNDCIPILDDFLNAILLDNIGQYIEILQAFVGDALVDWIANNVVLPLLQPTIDQLFPDPMGLEGVINIGNYMKDAGFLGVDSNLEIKSVSGGFVDIRHKGITAGIITGFNSDRDPATRTDNTNEYGVKDYSQNAKCVPPFASFDFSQLGLQKVTGVQGALADRTQTFTRPILQEFNGDFDQAYLKYEDGTLADIGIALTQEMMNLLGFHIVNSGALCVTLGTEQSPLLNVGSFAVLIPSLSELVDPRIGDAPLQLVIRPQNPLQFTVGQGSEGDTPLLDIYFNDFQIDLYPFVNGRYARALTLALDMHLFMDLEQGIDEEGNITVMPVLRPIDESQITARITNSDLIRESPEDVAAIFPSILGMIMPMMTAALQPIPLPNYEITKMNTNGDYLPWRTVKLDHLEFKPSISNDAILIVAKLVSVLAGQSKSLNISKAKFTAKVKEAVTYTPERLRNTLKGKDNARPYAIIQLQPKDDKTLEYQYRVDNGAWHPFAAGNTLTIKDFSLYLQGWHNISIRARYKGQPSSLNLTPVNLRILLDTVPPKAFPEYRDGQLELGGLDFVTKSDKLRYEVKDNDKWIPLDSGILSVSKARKYAQDAKLTFKVIDEANNSSEYITDIDKLLSVPLSKENEGFGCQSSGKSDSSLPIVLFMLFAFFIVKKFKNKLLPFLTIGILSFSLLSACGDSSDSKKNNDKPSCWDNDDCAGISCPQDEIALCISSSCECVDDLPWGIPGPFDSITVIGQFAWVSSYNPTYGDLMISKIVPSENGIAVIRPEMWEFIDGVPDGPVALPTSDIRWGINAKGTDVGTYTSIAQLSGVNFPIIAHHNEDTGSLRITYTLDGTDWISYDMDSGNMSGTGEGNAGLFNDLIISGEQKPQVAYMVNNLVSVTGTKLVSEIRFAKATTTVPESPTDWNIQIVDSVEYPFPTENEPLGDWPKGGLFVSQTVLPDGKVAITWFDQYSESLKLSYQASVDGTFVAPIELTPGDATTLGSDLPKGLFCDISGDSSNPNLIHFAYQDIMQRSLYYGVYDIDSGTFTQTLIDDGFRTEDGSNLAGLPMPVQHYFGSDAEIVVAGSKIYLIWQDATNQELYLGILDRSQNTVEWDIKVLRGGEEPYDGSVGFYIDAEVKGSKLYISNYGVNLHAEPDILGNPALSYFVEIYAIATGIEGK